MQLIHRYDIPIEHENYLPELVHLIDIRYQGVRLFIDFDFWIHNLDWFWANHFESDLLSFEIVQVDLDSINTAHLMCNRPIQGNKFHVLYVEDEKPSS